jgi:hypothetical protein
VSEIVKLRQERGMSLGSALAETKISPEEDRAALVRMGFSESEVRSFSAPPFRGLGGVVKTIASMLFGAGITTLIASTALAKTLHRRLRDKGIWLMMPGDEPMAGHALVDPSDCVPRQPRHFGNGVDRELRAERRDPLEESPGHPETLHRKRQPLNPRPAATGHAHRANLEIGLEVPDRAVAKPDSLELLEQPLPVRLPAVRTGMTSRTAKKVNDLDPPAPSPQSGSTDQFDRFHVEPLQPR